MMNVNPDFQGGFNTRVGYKGFDLSAVALSKTAEFLTARYMARQAI